MFPEVYYLLFCWSEKSYRERRQALEGNFALTDRDLTYVDIDANSDEFARLFQLQMEDIKHTILVEGNHSRFLDSRSANLQYLHQNYITRLQKAGYTPVEIVEESEKWCDHTKGIVTSVLDELKHIPKNPKKNKPFTRDPDKAFEEIRQKLFRAIDSSHDRLLSRIEQSDWLEATIKADKEPVAPTPKAKKRGRPSHPFSHFIIDPAKAQVITDRIRQLTKGKTGKEACRVLEAARSCHLIGHPSFSSFVNEFGPCGSESDYNKYFPNLTPYFNSSELAPTKKEFNDLS